MSIATAELGWRVAYGRSASTLSKCVRATIELICNFTEERAQRAGAPGESRVPGKDLVLRSKKEIGENAEKSAQ
jgi:hypothetical protein